MKKKEKGVKISISISVTTSPKVFCTFLKPAVLLLLPRDWPTTSISQTSETVGERRGRSSEKGSFGVLWSDLFYIAINLNQVKVLS